jgi:hypothetical protein
MFKHIDKICCELLTAFRTAIIIFYTPMMIVGRLRDKILHAPQRDEVRPGLP